MPRYIVAIHRPTAYDAASMEDDAMHRDIDRLNDDMVAAGIRVFVGGLQPPATARAITRTSDPTLLVTDGPYIESKEHVGGFWILDLPDLEAALSWGRKAATACRANVEVRPFY